MDSDWWFFCVYINCCRLWKCKIAWDTTPTFKNASDLLEEISRKWNIIINTGWIELIFAVFIEVQGRVICTRMRRFESDFREQKLACERNSQQLSGTVQWASNCFLKKAEKKLNFPVVFLHLVLSALRECSNQFVKCRSLRNNTDFGLS